MMLFSLLLLLGCPRPVPVAQPSTTASSTYKVAVAAASYERSITAVYTLDVRPEDDDVWVFTTTHTEGTWEESASTLRYDSAAPTPADPWPLTLQHAVASVPATVHFAQSGGPMGLVEEAGWKMAGMRVLTELDLPTEALAAGTNLLDPDGYILDLQRSFPGTPPDGLWVREERIAGVSARRIESCVLEEDKRQSMWTCIGTIEGPTEGNVRLYSSESKTMLIADRHGLVRLEVSHAGTLVRLDEAGTDVVDRPIAGQRLVVRQ